MEPAEIDMEVRRLRPEDIRAAAGIEQSCFSDPWSESLLRGIPGSTLDEGFLLLSEGRPAGYAVFRFLAGEGEIQRIAVLPEYRRLGGGGKLMEAMAAYARERQAERIVLEVREGNLAARNLYKSWGFREQGMRKGYYRNPMEAAVLMELPLA